MTAPLDRLAAILADADRDHVNDIDALDQLDDDQLAYLAHVDELPDPDSDGLEGRCV